ncbi:MAG: hypothetical protein QNJ38_12510 [Prochloraceae cyanobacterium]|nr:hypothetical protein [Prochloraceae cyanobacterium]
MKGKNQLTRLIWDFWREETEELKQLKVLGECKVSRWWWVLHIHCLEIETAQKIVAIESLIEEPLRELRLANQIKIWVDRNLFAAFKVNSEQLDRFKGATFKN